MCGIQQRARAIVEGIRPVLVYLCGRIFALQGPTKGEIRLNLEHSRLIPTSVLSEEAWLKYDSCDCEGRNEPSEAVMGSDMSKSSNSFRSFSISLPGTVSVSASAKRETQITFLHS